MIIFSGSVPDCMIVIENIFKEIFVNVSKYFKKYLLKKIFFKKKGGGPGPAPPPQYAPDNHVHDLDLLTYSL